MTRNAPELNPPQLRAIGHIEGPMLVRAGAGTGKTTVIVERILRLIANKHARAPEIVATTFTVDAAQEIRERVRDALGKAGDGLRCNTFHAHCNDILQRNRAGFELLDEHNLWVYLRRMIDGRELPLRYFQKAADPATFLHDLMQFFDRCNDELVSAADYRAYVERLSTAVDLPRVHTKKENETISREQIMERCREIAAVFETVEQHLRASNLGTFGLMIVRAVRLLENAPAILQAERDRTKFILIDEFQDCNTAQIRWAHLLAGPHANIFVVGDPDQAIYRFRGATSAAFDQFRRLFPACLCVSLAENQRSLAPVLECAHSMITKNPELRSDYNRTKLVSAREARSRAIGTSVAPAPVEIVVSENGTQEAFDIAKGILQLRKQDRKVKWQDIAVIYRQHSHRVALVEEFGARQIPFVVVGTDLLNTAPLRDLVAILKALDSADDISLFRMALMPRFAIDLHWLRTALQQSHRRTPLSNLLEARADGRALLEALRRFQRMHDLREMPMVTLLERVVSEWGLPQGEELNEFRRFVERWASGPLRTNGDLSSFLQYFDYFQQAGGKLLASIPPAQNAVRLMTAHAAKGLEFQHVFVIRVISRSFPASYSEPLFEFPEELGATPKSLCDLKEQHGEEERRLFYVAMTRARDSLTLHGKRAKGKQKVPSIFLRELDENKQLRPFCTTRDAVRLLFDMEANAPSVTEQAAWLRLPPPAPDATAKLSVHAVETYSACPLRYKLQREWSLPSEPVAAMQFGAAIHRVIHEYFRALAAGRAYQEADLIEIFRAELSAARLADPLQQELYENQGVQQLRRFLQRSDLPTAAEVVGAEQRFSISVGDVEVIGRVDRIDRVGNGTATQVAIVDYKTGGPRSEEDAEKSLQLSVYALAAIHQWGFQPVRLAYHNLEDDTVVSTEFDTGRLREVESKIEKAAAGIAAGAFEPKPSPFVCKRCEYRTLCPATEEKLYLIRTATSAAIH